MHNNLLQPEMTNAGETERDEAIMCAITSAFVEVMQGAGEAD